MIYYEGNEEFLAHYGVLGMRWGVRKDPEKAFTKSYDKLKKYRNKSEKFTEKDDYKLSKLTSKRSKIAKKNLKNERRMNSGLYSQKKREKAHLNFLKGTKKERKIESKILKLSNKKASSIKASEKANKWIKKMNKIFNNKKMSEFNIDSNIIGKVLIDMNKINSGRM